MPEGAAVTPQDAVDRLQASPDGFMCLGSSCRGPCLVGFDVCRHIRGGLRLQRVPIIARSVSMLSREMAQARAAGMSA